MNQKALTEAAIERKTFPMFTLTLEKSSLRKYKLESHSKSALKVLCSQEMD